MDQSFLRTQLSCVFEEKTDKEYVVLSVSGEADQMLVSSNHQKDLLIRRIIDHFLAAGGSDLPGRGVVLHYTTTTG